MSNNQEIHAIAKKLPQGERAAYLDEACESQEQREQVENLLRTAEERTRGNPGIPVPTPTMPEGPGTDIGPYKILRALGEGGFGVVYEAEQRQPFERRVALKVIKPGMDTKEVIARFEAERQALAMMDHPNIAKVLDAGTTSAGHPYFVMELVKGTPLLEFCNQHKLATRQRLELFLEVCTGVNHAHQKGIIHRDLKPANILVTRTGDKAVPKIIDFGIAKATRQRLTDKTLFTRFEQFVGTPLYISPEQATLNGHDVDTRSDIYSLGVVLYELLAGRPPFDPRVLREAGYEEMRRIIREIDPHKPSTRVSTLQDEEQTTVGLAHHTDPRKLRNLLHGELDWIVMKAIEKDRTRRYETANAFAVDIRHFLHDEPVAAAAPGAAYRLRKFARRNKGRLTAAGTVVLALLLATVTASWQTVHANRHNRQANLALERLRTTAPAFLSQAENLVLAQRFDEALGKIDQALALQPQSVEYLMEKAGLLECLLHFQEAADAYDAVAALHPDHVHAVAGRKRCEQMIALAADDGSYPRGALETLFEKLQKEQRPVAALIPLARQLGRESHIRRDYWLARLRDLPIGPDKPLSDRLRITEAGLLDLDLSHTTITDLRVLKELPLRFLDLTACLFIENLSPLHDTSTESLQLSGAMAEDLSSIRAIPNLKSLTIRDSPVGSLAPLHQLNLTQLSLIRCGQIDDLSPLRGMPLQELLLEETPAKSLAPLAGMPLRTLTLISIPADNVEALRGLPLDHLQLVDNSFLDLAFLEDMPLRLLRLSGCKNARNLQPVANLGNLEILVLPSDCTSLPPDDQEAIDALHKNPGLQISDQDPGGELALETSLASDVFWEQWEKFRSIFRPLHQAGVTFQLEPDGPDGLSLQSSDSKLTEIGFLRKAREKGARLTKLDLASTGISDLEPLRGMPLRELKVHRTQVADLGPLVEMDQLHRLEVAGAPVRDLSPLRKLPLRFLTIDDTQVSDISPLTGISTLESLCVSPSQGDFAQLRDLPRLEWLSFLWNSQHGRPMTRSCEFWGIQALKRGDWDEALTLFEEAGMKTARLDEVEQPNGLALICSGVVLAMVADQWTYDHFCGRALSRFGASDDPALLRHTAKAASLRENALSREALAIMRKSYRLTDESKLRPWAHLTMAVAEYRCRNFARSEEFHARIHTPKGTHQKTQVRLLEAMLAWQRGDADRATIGLEQVGEDVAQLRRDLPDTITRNPRGWHDHLASLLFFEEATELIRIRPFRDLVKAGDFVAAERQTREWLAVRESTLPDHRQTWQGRSLLGASLLGQKRYEAAERELQAAWAGLKRHEIPSLHTQCLVETVQRLVNLYEDKGDTDQVRIWSTRLNEQRDARETWLATRRTAEKAEGRIHQTERAGWRASLQHNWKQAAYAYAKVLDDPAFDQSTHVEEIRSNLLGLQMGTAFVRAGDHARHEQLCRMILEVFPDAPSVNEAQRFAKLCFLEGANPPGDLREHALKWGRFAAANCDREGNPPWTCLSAGIAEFHAGETGKAITLFEEARTFERGVSCRGLAMLYQAMALERQGQIGEAAAMLHDAENLLSRRLETKMGEAWWELEHCQMTLERAWQALGLSLAERKQYAEAKLFLVNACKALQGREEEVPGLYREELPKILNHLEQICKANGQPEEAADWHSLRTGYYESLQARLERARVDEKNRERVRAALQRGRDASEKRDWPEAAEAYAKALDDNAMDWPTKSTGIHGMCLNLQMGTAFVRTRDREHYRKLCGQVSRHLPDPPHVVAAERFTKLCFLDHRSLPKELQEKALKIARFMVKDQTDQASLGWRCFTAGIAEYYTGDLKDAEKLFIKAENAPDKAIGFLRGAMVFRALTLKELDRDKEAEKLLREAESLLPDSLETGVRSNWWDLELCRMALELAKEKIGPPSAPSPE